MNALQRPPVRMDSGQGRLDSIVDLRLPWTEVVKLPQGPRVTLTLVSGCVRKIPEIRVLQKVDGAEFAVAQIVFVRGSNENVFEQQVGPSKIEASQPSKHTPKERGPTFSAAVSQFEPTPLRCLRFSMGLIRSRRGLSSALIRTVASPRLRERGGRCERWRGCRLLPADHDHPHNNVGDRAPLCYLPAEFRRTSCATTPGRLRNVHRHDGIRRRARATDSRGARSSRQAVEAQGAPPPSHETRS